MPLQTIQPRGQITLTRDVRRAAGIEPGDVVMTRVTGPGTVELKVIPRLTLAELLARYRIERPINEAADREQWQAAASQEVLGTTNG
jgi:bifunctional DNA-binding transcriptional regulator/antitoxin component of YhaV-PrlF toxin-antitoxin module